MSGPGGKLFYQAFNLHPTKVLHVKFHETIYYVSRPPGSPDPYETSNEFERSIPAGNGIPVNLGCRYTQHQGGPPESFDEHTFTPISADLDGDHTTATQIQPAPPGRCTACLNGYCLHINLRNLPDPNRDKIILAMSKSIGSLLLDDPLKSISITDLLALGPPLPDASREITFHNAMFFSGGSTDSFTVSFPLQNVAMATVAIPATLKGTVSRQNLSKASKSFAGATLSFDEADSIRVYYYDAHEQFLGSEYVKAIDVKKNSVMLTGSRRYCVKIDGPYTR